MNYFQFCRKCKKSTCCTIPFYAFVTKSEYEKITSYLTEKNIHFKTQDLFQKIASTNSHGTSCYLISKKKNGKCLFLGKDRKCLIQDVKPLDCLVWPLTYEFIPSSHQIIFYLGDCLFVNEMKKINTLKKWINTQIKKLQNLLSNYTEIELIAYNILPDLIKYDILHQEPFSPKSHS